MPNMFAIPQGEMVHTAMKSDGCVILETAWSVHRLVEYAVEAKPLPGIFMTYMLLLYIVNRPLMYAQTQVGNVFLWYDESCRMCKWSKYVEVVYNIHLYSGSHIPNWELDLYWNTPFHWRSIWNTLQWWVLGTHCNLSPLESNHILLDTLLFVIACGRFHKVASHLFCYNAKNTDEIYQIYCGCITV